MPVLEIIQAGLLTTVQDLGREGGHFYAIPRAGAMDREAATLAALLVGNGLGTPVLECTSTAPTIRFLGPARIALTGADFGWTLNGEPLARRAVLEVQADDVLAGGHARKQLRGYLAVAGTWTGKSVYGSVSTYLQGQFGGHEGRQLKKGDRLEWEDRATPKTEVPVIPLRKGPEFGYLTAEAQARLVAEPYTIDAATNRMGARLTGPRLEGRSYQLENSAPVLPGFVQLPPSGLPIVVLQDGQVSGGYPRIAYIPEGALSVFNQVPLGRAVRFVWE